MLFFYLVLIYMQKINMIHRSGSIYLFKLNNVNTRTVNEIYLKSTLKTAEQMVSWTDFTFFWRFHCLFWTSNFRWDTTHSWYRNPSIWLAENNANLRNYLEPTELFWNAKSFHSSPHSRSKFRTLSNISRWSVIRK